jgi:hypothetical protein
MLRIFPFFGFCPSFEIEETQEVEFFLLVRIEDKCECLAINPSVCRKEPHQTQPTSRHHRRIADSIAAAGVATGTQLFKQDTVYAIRMDGWWWLMML